MHELSIALNIVDIAEQEAKERNVAVTAVHLKLGPLSGVVKESLLFSYGLACEGTPLEGSTLVIEETSIVAYCESCRSEQNLVSMQSCYCPNCRAPLHEIRQGRELEVVALEVL